jgi:hypothetical protein
MKTLISLMACLLLCGTVAGQNLYLNDGLKNYRPPALQSTAFGAGLAGSNPLQMNTTLPKMSYKQAFWAGAIGGFTGPIAGALIGSYGAESLNWGTKFGLASNFTGIALGFVVPGIIVYSKTSDWKAVGKSALGSLAGLGVDIVLVLALELIFDH